MDNASINGPAAEEVEENLMKTTQGFEDGINAYTCKVSRTDAEVDRDFTQLFQHISPEAQQSLRQSPARIIAVGPQNLGLRGGAGGESSSSSSSEDGDNNNGNNDNNLSDFNYPKNPVPFPEALGNAVPVEILMNIREYLPPVDELLLSHTHPNVFNTDRFSFYQLDVEYQLGFQNGNPAYTEERLPLLFWAIKTGAPLTVIRDIWDTWRNNGMDLDLNWARNGPPRQLVGFFKPIHVAVLAGRLDVVQQLREWGANVDRLGWTAILSASDPACHTRFDDATWLALEDLAIQRYDEGEPFRNMPPNGIPGVPLCEGCVSVGWVRLLRRYLDPWADANFQPATLVASVRNNEIRGHHNHLMRTMDRWMDLVGRVRNDNTAMIDYLADVIARSRAITSAPLPPIRWAGLEYLMLRGVRSEEKSGDRPPVIHRNAIHIIQRFLPDYQNMARVLTNLMIIRRYMESVDNLAVLQNIFFAITGLNGQTPGAIRIKSRLLREAVGSVTGVPQIVAWLLQQEGVLLHHSTSQHVLTRLRRCREPAGIRANLAALMTRVGPNEELPGWHREAQQAGARPLDLLHVHNESLVELVARGGVDLTLAGPQTRRRAQANRDKSPVLFEIQTGGRTLEELLRSEHMNYSTGRRIVDWCIVNSTNVLTPQIIV